MVKNLSENAGDVRDTGLIRGSRNLLEEDMATHSMPGELRGQRSLAGYDP